MSDAAANNDDEQTILDDNVGDNSQTDNDNDNVGKVDGDDEREF